MCYISHPVISFTWGLKPVEVNRLSLLSNLSLNTTWSTICVWHIFTFHSLVLVDWMKFSKRFILDSNLVGREGAYIEFSNSMDFYCAPPPPHAVCICIYKYIYIHSWTPLFECWWVGVGGFSKVVATFKHVGGSFYLFMATMEGVWIIPSFPIWGCVLHAEHISCVITNCGQHQWAIPSLVLIVLEALLEENIIRKLLSLSLDLFFKILLFQVTFLIFFCIAIFSPYFLWVDLLLQYVALFQSGN